jgi:hypothetical protein
MHQRKSIFFLQKVSLMILSLVSSDWTFLAEIMNDVSLVSPSRRNLCFVFQALQTLRSSPAVNWFYQRIMHPSIHPTVCLSVCTNPLFVLLYIMCVQTFFNPSIPLSDWESVWTTCWFQQTIVPQPFYLSVFISTSPSFICSSSLSSYLFVCVSVCRQISLWAYFMI